MELALTAALLLPGAVSLGLATGSRCRAVEPRDLPGALIATLAFAVANFALAALLCKATWWWGAPGLGGMVAALIEGTAPNGTSRAQVIASLTEVRAENVTAAAYLLLATWFTGWLARHVYDRTLRAAALDECSSDAVRDPRTSAGKLFDRFASWLGLRDFVITRGASYWLVVEHLVRLVSPKHRYVYADIIQGESEGGRLYTGQVLQVITSRAGETKSVVLLRPLRYRRADRQPYGAVSREGWVEIGDSEAFYLRGDNIQNISYRVYGDKSKGGYERTRPDGTEWLVHEAVLKTLRRFRTALAADARQDPGLSAPDRNG